MDGIAESDVRAHLGKVLASNEFAASERLCRFLRFTVEARLCGRQDQIKEYLIGKEVFDRNDDYDPRLDPIVRVEARRLRKKLEEYYAGPGVADAIRIAFPKGSYVPEIQPAAPSEPPAPAPPPAPRRSWMLAAAFLCIALAGLAAARYYRAQSANTMAVLPARWVWPSEDFPAIRHDEDLAERVAANLANQHKVPVVGWPAIQRFRGRTLNTRAMAAELAVTRLLMIAVRVESDGFRVTAFLIDPQQDRKLRVTDLRNAALLTPADREAVAARIAAEFRAN